MYKKRLVYSCDLDEKTLKTFCKEWKQRPKLLEISRSFEGLEEGFWIIKEHNENHLMIREKLGRHHPIIEVQYTEDKKIIVEIRPGLASYAPLIIFLGAAIFCFVKLVFWYCLVIFMCFIGMFAILYFSANNTLNELNKYFKLKFRYQRILHTLEEENIQQFLICRFKPPPAPPKEGLGEVFMCVLLPYKLAEALAFLHISSCLLLL